MSKLSFRARALDPSKPMPIYLADELPDLPEYSAINRAVPQMPSGMEKEEESEHHLQRAICAGLLIPTPEVSNVDDEDFYNRVYPDNYKMPKQLIHMQPLGIDQDIPDYDMDAADEIWVESQARRLDLTPLKFEQMMDKLEKSSGQTVVTLNEAKALLKEDDDVSTAVFDYWLNKRLTTQAPLIPAVKTENRTGMAPNNPYLAFRRRTEKMQTRKNRKNDESSYEKMWKLKRELSRAVTLLEMIKRREKAKRAQLLLTIEIFEKRYAARDFSGQLVQDVVNSMARSQRPACAPLHSNQYQHSPLSSTNLAAWSNSGTGSNSYHLYNSSSQYHSGTPKGHHSTTIRDADGNIVRKEKRQYRKRKHKLQKEKGMQSNNSLNMGSIGHSSNSTGLYTTPGHQLHQLSSSGLGHHGSIDTMMSSDEDEFNNGNNVAGSESEDEGLYAFKRNRNCNYHKPITEQYGDWPWVSTEENGKADKKYRFTLTSIRHPRPRCIGFARRRMTRGGRIALDRCATTLDEFWQNLDYTIFDSEKTKQQNVTSKQEDVSVVEDRLCGSGAEIVGSNLERIRARVSSIRTSSASEGGYRNVTPSPLSFVAGRLNTGTMAENVIKRESVDTPTPAMIKIKEEQLDDYERLIDSVNNDRNNKQTGSCSSNNTHNNNNSNLHNNLTTSTGTTPIVSSKGASFTNEFLDYAVKSERTGSVSSTSSLQNLRLTQHQHPQQTDTNVSIAHLLGPSAATNTTTTASNNYQLSHTQESRDSGISIKSESINDNDALLMHQLPQELSDSIYDEFLDEIERSWLHFRPKTPPLSPSSPPNDTIISSSDMLNYDTDCIDTLSRLANGPFNVELQTLEGQLPQNIFADNEESVFVTTEPINLDSLLSETMLNRLDKDSSKSLEMVNASGSHDSLNELGLNESNDDNEKLLANILEECQMEDGKALNQTSNFWNGLLEEDGNPLPVTLDLDALDRASTPKFDRSIGYCSDALSLYSKNIPGDDVVIKSTTTIASSPVEKDSKKVNPQLKCLTEVGRSHFKLSRTKSDQLLHLKLKSANSQVKSESVTSPLDDSVPIKAEPIDEISTNNNSTSATSTQEIPSNVQTIIDSLTPSIRPVVVSSTTDPTTTVTSSSTLPETVVIKQEQIVTSCDATASHDYAAPVPVPVVSSAASPTIIPTMVKSATLIRTSAYLPGGGQIWQQQNTNNSGIRRQINGPVLQNLLRSSNTYISSPQQQKPQNTIIDDATSIRDIKIKQNNSDSGSNHNTSLQEQQQPQQVNIIHGNLPQQFAIIGSTTGTGPGGQNRIFLTSTNPQQMSTVSQAGNNTTLTTIPSTAIIMNDGKTTADGKTLQQRVKIGDNRILYTTNIKNNRGQLVTQLNQKVLNIVPIGHQKNNILSQGVATSQGTNQPQGLQAGQTINVVSGTPLSITKSGHMIHRVATINNSQNIRANNTGGGVTTTGNIVTQQQQQQQQQQKVIGLVSAAPAGVVDI
uniref:Enhancer of polycomb-like protein n=1 Tax=Culicoides sonorensis TaxID=179676 RepID=A0A336K437_CULSO